MLVPSKDQLVVQRVHALEQVGVTDVRKAKGPTDDAIDVVIAWVDGRDRKHRAKRNRYVATPGGDAEPERDAQSGRRLSAAATGDGRAVR